LLPLPPFFVSLVYFVFLLSGVPNAVQVDDALFNYVDTALPFFQASADCLASYGGSLASIHSETENTAVYELNPTLEARWIGLYEASDVEDVFSWTDGTNVTYTNWQDGEPNNFLGNPEKCGVMHKLSGADVAAGTWNDVECDSTAPYVCKRNLAYEGIAFCLYSFCEV
tara:strand:- start:314 stop:820 length:507 start_codon:yes stop_codon:yes gene_type:complete